MTARPCLLLLLAAPALAQRGATAPHATTLRPTPLYLQADAGSSKLATVEPGRELTILQRGQGWLQVQANTDEEVVREQDRPVFSDSPEQHPVSGWLEDQAAVTADTPNGEAVLFGEAISFEQAASAPHPPADAAQTARRLYRLDAEIFPSGTRAAEAAWRSADIRWQLQKEDAATLPSAHEQEPYLRQLPDESEMKKIEKQYAQTKWAGYAAYALIDNKLCGDWQGSEKCPEKETAYFTKFVEQYPDSPKAPQALYEAAWRMACAGDLWAADNEDKHSAEDRKRAVDLSNQLVQHYPTADYAARGASLAFKVQHGIPVYGNDRR